MPLIILFSCLPQGSGESYLEKSERLYLQMCSTREKVRHRGILPATVQRFWDPGYLDNLVCNTSSPRFMTGWLSNWSKLPQASPWIVTTELDHAHTEVTWLYCRHSAVSPHLQLFAVSCNHMSTFHGIFSWKLAFVSYYRQNRSCEIHLVTATQRL